MSLPKYITKELVTLTTKIASEAIASIVKPPKPKKELSKKAKEVSDIIEGSDFGCQTDAVCKLMSVLLGEPIKVSKKGKKSFEYETYLPPHTAVVLLYNNNGHTYTLNTVHLIARGDILYKKSGDTGNHAPLENLEAWRLATPEEIDSFFA